MVNKLSRHKSWEFSSNENRRPGIVSHSLINENINSENLSEKNSKVSCLSGPNRNSNSYNNNNDEGQPLNIRNHLSPYLKDDEDGENIQLENHFIQRDPVSMCGNQGLHRVGTTGFLDLSKGKKEKKKNIFKNFFMYLNYKTGAP